MGRIFSKIAGVKICIDHDTPECGEVTRRFLRDHLIPEGENSDFVVKFSTDKSLLKFSFTHSQENAARDKIGMSVEAGNISNNEKRAVLPDMAEESAEVADFILDNFLRICLQYIIPQHNGIILHASSVAYRGKSFIFIGPNSGGKSTIARNTAKETLSDDCVALRRGEGNTWKACGTPWGDVHASGEYPVEAVFFIEKSDDFYFKKIETITAVRGLFANASFSFPDLEKKAGDILENVLDVVTRAAADIPAYCMGFRKDDNVIELLTEKGFTWSSEAFIKQ